MNFRNLRAFCLTAGWCLAMLVFLAGGGRAADVEQWGVWEASLDGPREGNPYLDVELSCTLRHDGDSVTVRGFYDGDGVYKVRFSPPSQGSWRYETRSNRPELDGKSGSFTVGPPSANNHGPVQVFQTFYLRYADGSPYHQFGTTCYAWVHQPRELQEQTLKTLAASPFNKIRFCVFPKSYYIANKNEPELFAFRKGADGKFDFSRPDPAFWRHFERRILDLQKLGIEADIILWHPYDRWGFSEMSDAEDDRYLRYCIARLSAYRNVWWSLANEYDFMTDQAARRPRRQQAVGGLGPVLLDPPEGGPAPAAAQHPQRRQGVRPHEGLGHARQPPVLGHERRGALPRPVSQAGHLRRVPVRGRPQGHLGQPDRARDGAAVLARHAQRLLRRPRRDLQAPARTSSGGPRAACCTARARSASSG